MFWKYLIKKMMKYFVYSALCLPCVAGTYLWVMLRRWLPTRSRPLRSSRNVCGTSREMLELRRGGDLAAGRGSKGGSDRPHYDSQCAAQVIHHWGTFWGEDLRSQSAFLSGCIDYTFFYIFLIQFELELCKLDAQLDTEHINHVKSFMPNSFLSGLHLNAVTCTMLQ